MIYKVYCDDYLLHHSQLDDYRVLSPSLNVELNKTGSFTFTIYPDHINYGKIEKLKSIITIYQDDALIFRGRVLNDTPGFYNEKQVSCEGELAFLIDSIQRPFTFPANDDDPATPADYFTFLINRHNAQVPAAHQFAIGSVTVTDNNDYMARSDTEFSTTWELINQGLISSYGGYLCVDSDDNGNRRINYLEDFDVMSTQPIKLGLNLLDISTERKGEDVATAILPLGKQNEDEETSEERLTIESLPDEETDDICKSGDFVYSKVAEELYGGRIMKAVTWDSVTIASNLLTKAKSKLAETRKVAQTVTLTAADLSAAGYDFNSFKLGLYVSIEDELHADMHALENSYLVKSLSISLDNPGSNKLTLGSTIYTLTEQNKINQDKQQQFVKTNIEKSESKVIKEIELRTSAQITQTESNIMSRVEEGYYTKDDTDALVSSVSSELEQTAQGFEMRFTTINNNINDVQSGANAKFTEIDKYIRFENGEIVLGALNFNQIQRISSTQNGFYVDDALIAYISGRKLYITDGEFLNSLILGKFAFVPRANGSLDFKKVKD